jgi:hypothetical protein
MIIRLRGSRARLLIGVIALAVSSSGLASTLNQNVSWTVDRAGTSSKFRIVAYGDSIYAGYNGSTTNAARYSAPTVDAEYLSALWNADIESIRRTKSGAVASDVYNNKIVAERSWMQASSTRVVTYVSAAMNYINANAHPNTKLKVIANLFYPGYNADNVQSTCKSATTGATVNMRDAFLPALARMNYWMCEYARQKGFKCADSFAQYMGADYDRNGDGKIDSEALRYVAGESEASYVNRISVTLKSTLRDANLKLVTSSSSFDYIQSDDVHPTFTGGTVTAGLFGGSTGSGAPRQTSFTGGKSTIWNRFGHERMGWSLSVFNPASP